MSGPRGRQTHVRDNVAKIKQLADQLLASSRLISGGGAGLSTEAKQDTQITALGTLLTELEWETRIGEVQATPTANTVLGRLKEIADNIGTGGGGTSSSTLSSVASSATNVTVLAANANRKKAIIFNDSTQVLYLKFGATATSSSFTYKVFPDAHVTVEKYTGIIDGVWASANGNARVTELD